LRATQRVRIFAGMTQASLFDGAGPRVLLAGEAGRVDYTPGFIPPALASAWFDRLHGELDWRSERRLMYEREVDTPRLLASVRLDDPRLHPVLADAAQRVLAALGVPFDSIGLNLYRDGHDSVAPHGDRLGDLVAGLPIALLSFGATRRMTIRAKPPRRGVLHVDLEAGSLLVMDYASQAHYDHGIPKQADPVGPRISAVFRARR
jgi:alkylated DNA repair dioxygenase AlkB